MAFATAAGTTWSSLLMLVSSSAVPFSQVPAIAGLFRNF
jgi:hypothetical protein